MSNSDAIKSCTYGGFVPFEDSPVSITIVCFARICINEYRLHEKVTDHKSIDIIEMNLWAKLVRQLKK